MDWIKITPETMPPDGELVTLKCVGERRYYKEYEYSVFGMYNAENNEFIGLQDKDDKVEFWKPVGPKVMKLSEEAKRIQEKYLIALEEKYSLDKIKDKLCDRTYDVYDILEYVSHVAKIGRVETHYDYPPTLVISKEDLENADISRLWQLYAIILESKNKKMEHDLESMKEQRDIWIEESKKFEHALKTYDVENAREHIAKKIATNIVNGFLPGYKLVEKDKLDG